jgi:signal transduction histidine kinase
LFPKEIDIFVYADKERITQVISNLLENSIKFIEGESLIQITIKKTTKDENIEQSNNHQVKDLVFISIRDTGIGILDEIYPRLSTKLPPNLLLGQIWVIYFKKYK